MTVVIKKRLRKKISRPPLLVGMLDSGVETRLGSRVVAAQAFLKGELGAIEIKQAHPDRLGHGTTLASIIAERVPEARFVVAQIFTSQLLASAHQAAAGLDWLVAQEVKIVNMSFGLRVDREPLAQACQRAIAAGVVLVAASPAMGAAVFPSAYPGVIRVTGDVRCAADEFSQMDSPQAEYGACVRVPGSPVAGASVATAYISAVLARYLSRNPVESSLAPARPDGLRSWLNQTATYRGMPTHFDLIPPERRLRWEALESQTAVRTEAGMASKGI
ncbi:MAG: S8 family serine peptidase [Halopseudomonas sp.]